MVFAAALQEYKKVNKITLFTFKNAVAKLQ